MENGRNATKLGTLKAIAQVLERPVEDLLAGSDELGETQ
jgi:hypothetical protein